MDIHVKDAQLVKYHHQLTCTTAMSHNALENIPSELQSTLKLWKVPRLPMAKIYSKQRENKMRLETTCPM
jgi:hypothetical protein